MRSLLSAGSKALCAAAAFMVLGTFSAEAHHRHHHAHGAQHAAKAAESCTFFCGQPTTTVRSVRQARSYRGESTVTGGRPAGCPHAFCGCQASLEIFGRIIPELNLAYNWIRYFNRAEPGPDIAAARSGHVLVLKEHKEGTIWMAKDGNSGHHLTRYHAVDVAQLRARGYVFVDPRSPRRAFASHNGRARLAFASY